MQTTAPFSPIALVGTVSLLAAYLIGAWCVAAGIAGNARKSRALVNSSVYGLYAFAALVGLASALLIYAFVTHDFSIKYVAHTADVTMSIWYKVTAFWGGLDGSLLFWVLVLGLFSTVAIAVNAKRHRDMIGYVVATIMVVQVFFLSLLIFNKNPFSTFLTTPPPDGQGLNPLLQNYWMVIHPPSLYIGFVAATIPFAFGIGALASGRLDDMWLGSVRVWMLICFFFLSLGLILGGRWAYEELGWGGYWAWDPVENAGLIPWFTATAFLHSAIIQEQRGMMKQWNLLLVILTFFLTIFGTFMTRSGVVQSVHAFGEDNVLALQFIIFMGCILIVSIGLMIYRSSKLTSKGSRFESFISREFAFLVNNWILLACAFFVLFSTMFPTISEAVDGGRVSVGIEFFNKWMTPLGLVLLLLAGAAPLLAWRKTTADRLYQQFVFPLGFMAATIVVLLIFFPQVTHKSAIFSKDIELPVSLICFGVCGFAFASIVQEFWRGAAVRRKQTGSDPFSALVGLTLAKRRKYGGYIIHLGVAVMFVGFGGKAYDRMTDKTIAAPAISVGMSKDKPYAERQKWREQYLDEDGAMTRLDPNSPHAFKFGDYVFLYENLVDASDDNKNTVTAQVSIWKNGENLGQVYPAKWDYRKGGEATNEVAIKVRPQEDVYVVLTGYDLEKQLANFRVFINPLISWVWIGFLILAAGTFVCLFPASLIARMYGKRSVIGRAAGDISIVLLVAGGLVALSTKAEAQAEHAGTGMGDTSIGWASMNRPNNDTEASAMKELHCPCGGCTRESLYICKCQTAATLRAWVIELINERDPSGKARFDLSKKAGREAAYNYALDEYEKQYGSQYIATPKSSASWLLPSLGVIGGLGLLLVVGRRFVGRKGDTTTVAATTGAAPAASPADDAYADKLDDELAATDD